MRRPELRQIPVDTAAATLLGQSPGQCVITMSVGQWDGLLQAAYNKGWTLLELNEDEKPVAGYQKSTITELEQEVEKAKIDIALKMGSGRELRKAEEALRIARQQLESS